MNLALRCNVEFYSVGGGCVALRQENVKITKPVYKGDYGVLIPHP